MHIYGLKKITLCFLLALPLWLSGQGVNSNTYLNSVKTALNKTWPNNRTINLVFHGHSVPAGYYQTPVVNTLASYPFLALRDTKLIYPFAVINTITTAIGGESSRGGATRFNRDIIGHRPDVLFIDYALNDRNLVPGNTAASLAEAKRHWTEMITTALDSGYKVILMTPTPDTNVDILAPDNILALHSAQIRFLADSFQIGLVDSYQAFKDLVQNGANLNDFMAQGNHPNDAGHEVVAAEIKKWFLPDTTIKSPIAYFKFDSMTIDNTDTVTYAEQSDLSISLRNSAEILHDPERYNVLSLNRRNSHGQLSAPPFNDEDLSISFWIKKEENIFWQQVLYFEEAQGRHLIALTQENWFPSKSLVFYRNGIAGVATTDNMLEVVQWHHIVFVFESGTAKLYLDGVLTSTNDNFTMSGYTFTDYYVGSLTRTAKCKLDDLLFFADAINQKQVSDIYQEQKEASPVSSPPQSVSPLALPDEDIGFIHFEHENIRFALNDHQFPQETTYVLYSMQGKPSSRGVLKNGKGILNISTTANGVYLIQLTNSQKKETLLKILVHR